MKSAALTLPLLLAACHGAVDCLPAEASPGRERFRHQLQNLVHVSQCPGLPTPRALQRAEELIEGGKRTFLERIRASRLAPDLERAVRDDQELSRLVNEADCAIYSPEYAETPEGRGAYEEVLRTRERNLAEARGAYEQLEAGCAAR